MILIIKKRPDNFKQKINGLKEAMRDDLFLDDLKEISEDFKAVDLEIFREFICINFCQFENPFQRPYF